MKKYHQLILALVIGAVAGLLVHPYADSPALQTLNRSLIEPVGQVFLRLIFMVVIPMVTAGLMLGVFELSQHNGLRRVAGFTLLYTFLASSISVLFGIGLVNLFHPGSGLTLQLDDLTSQDVGKIKSSAESAKPFYQAILEIIPTNPLAAATRAFDGEMLSVMFFALIFGWALSQTLKNAKGKPIVVTWLEQIYAASMQIVALAMKMAPVAVACLVYSSTFKFGHELLISLSYYVLVVIAGLLIQQFVVYSVMLKGIGRTSPMGFFRSSREVLLYAFATASSNATLPRSLDLAENILKIPAEIGRFVLTVGSTANQNGTALFEGVTVLFLAQVYGIDLSIGQQVLVVLMSILAGIGTAGVPGGSLPLIMILLQQVGIPPEGLGLILGVDRLLDICRTMVNVSGDLVIAKLVGNITTGEKAG